MTSRFRPTSALVLYKVTALAHYTLHSTGRGALAITWFPISYTSAVFLYPILVIDKTYICFINPNAEVATTSVMSSPIHLANTCFLSDLLVSSPVYASAAARICVCWLALGAHALASVTVSPTRLGYSSWCVCVCVSGLNLLLQGSSATKYYTYVFFTMNARFYMCGVR